MKRTNTRQLTTFAILAVFALAAGVALAQVPGKGMGKGMAGRDCDGDFGKRGDRGEMRLERLAERLDLTEDQVTAIRGIREEGRQENLEIRKKMMRLRNELQGEMLQDEPSQKKVLDLNDRMGELRTQQRANRLKNRLAVREQLTPEQRDRMLVMKERGQGRRGGHGMERGPRRGMGPRHGNGSGRFGGSRGMGQGLNPDCPNLENADD